jgi:outer membrane protein assembly factor BamB
MKSLIQKSNKESFKITRKVRMNDVNNEKEKRDRSITWYHFSKRVAIIAAFFSLLIGIIMIVNFLQTRSVDPLKVEVINKLVQQLQENPGQTDIKEQIRAVDLLARKAFFINKWQIRTGSYLLVVFIVILLISMKYMGSLKKKLPDLKKTLDEEELWANKILSKKYIILAGILLFVLALASGFLSESYLDQIETIESKLSASTDMPTSMDKIKKNWPGFRGPQGIGISYHKGIPTMWDGKSGKNILWKTPIPYPGFNSPIVWEDKLFLSGADRKNQLVYCININNGELLWQKKIENVPGSPEKIPKPSSDTGYAAATMSTDGERVFVVFATGDIAGLDFEGQILWTKNLGAPKNHYGHSSSLINHQHLLLIQYDQNNGGRLVALKSESGEVEYDIKRQVQISWASPILVNTGKSHEVILNSNPLVISYDPLTGRELWRVNCMSGEVAPSLGYSNGMVFAVNEYAVLAAIELGSPAKIVWEHDEELSEVSSPLATDKFLIMAASYGVVTCFDLKSGEKFWSHEFQHGFYSSPILAENRVFLVDMEGMTYILNADKEFKQLGKNDLGEKVVATPAFSDKRIYLRGYTHLYCLGEK